MLGLSLVAIGVGLEGVGINDSFVIDQLIELTAWLSVQLEVFGIAYNLVGVDNLDFPWFWKGFLDFVLDILTHDVIIQLGVSFAVESEASNLAFHFSFIRSIPIVLGSSTDKFLNVFILS